MFLGQPVYAIIQHDGRHVHVVAQGVNPVRSADAAAITIAHDDEYVQIGAFDLDALGDRQGAAVQTVKAVGLEIVREAAGAADPGDEYRLLGRQSLVATQALYSGEYTVVAATDAPARYYTLIVLDSEAFVDQF